MIGVLDSGRADVPYEDFRGHKLDRQMLDFLQRYGAVLPQSMRLDELPRDSSTRRGKSVNTDLRRTVTKLLAELDGPGAESAFFALKDLPDALPLVAEAYERESDGGRRESLIHCLWQFRDSKALSTLSAALYDPDDRVWKEALDGIVTLGGDAALRVLEEARHLAAKNPTEEVRREWIEEAIRQIQGNYDSGRV